MSPTRLEITQENQMIVTWPDGVEHRLSLQYLRDQCPCAGCKGETILGKHYSPVKLQQYSAGMYELTDLQPVGNYAVQAYWKDGHDTGIYTWDYLRILGREERTSKGQSE